MIETIVTLVPPILFVTCFIVFILIFVEFVYKNKTLAYVQLIGWLIAFTASAVLFKIEHDAGREYKTFAVLTIICLINTLLRTIMYENWESIEEDRKKRKAYREKRKKKHK
jgi:uncharacterized membrane protein